MAAPNTGSADSPTGLDSVPSFEEFEAAQASAQKDTAEQEAESAVEEEVAEETEAATEEATTETPKPDAALNEAVERRLSELWTEFEQSGDLNKLPSKRLQSQFGRLLTKLGMAQKAYEEQTAALKAREVAPVRQTATSDTAPPALDPEAEARINWLAEQKAKQLVGTAPDKVAELERTLNEYRAQAQGQERAAMVRQMEGYTPEVEAEMLRMIGERPMWGRLYWDDDGGLQHFYETARTAVQARSAEAAEAKRKAGLPKRVTPRPTGGGVAATGATPKKKHKDVSEAVDDAMAQLEEEFGIPSG